MSTGGPNLKIHREGLVAPVTALHYLTISDWPTLLLAGQGGYLKVFHVQSGRLLAQSRVFPSQSIHGITSHTLAVKPLAYIVVWGARYLHLLSISHDAQDLDRQANPLLASLQRIQCPDWILDVSCNKSLSTCNYIYTALLTANNVLLHVVFRDGLLHHFRTFGCSTKSILYSAHISWTTQNRIVITAGTVFGEILLWSCLLELSEESRAVSNPRCVLHQRLFGHEGSVFGVHLSDEVHFLNGSPLRLLFSCSDDRTVRVWNVANLVSDVEDDSSITIQGDRENLDKVQTGFGNTIDSTNLLPSHGQCIAKEWGHSSRIWGVRSLFGTTINDLKGFSTNLISYGEDAQSQLWKFSVKSAMIAGSKIGENINKLEHIGTFRAHSGKNIWSMAVDYDKSDSTNNLATGGADGQISISQVHQSIPSRTKTIDCELALSNILESLPTSASDFSTLSNLSCIDTDSFHGYFALQDGGYLIVTRGGRLITGSCPALSSASAEPDFKETGFDLRDLGSPIVKSNYCRLSNSLFAVCEDQKLYHLQMGSPCIRTMGISNFHAARIFLCALPNESFSAKVEEHNLTQRYGGASPMTKEAGNLVLITYFKTNIVDLYVSVDRSSTHKTPKISISLDPTFVLTSAVFTPFGCKLVLGSRAGTLAYYRIHGLSSRNSAENLSLSLVDFDKFHKDSINKIIDLSLFEAKGCILTVSEDGTYAIHRHGQSGEWSEGFEKYRPLEKSNNAPMAPRTASGRLLHSSSPKCLSAIKNAYFDKTSGSLMLVGFCTNDFIVWNETLQVEHMRHHMRGGIKGSFAFHETGIGSLREKTLVYTQNSKHRVVISKGESQKVLQQANFGRDLKALAVRPISPRGDLGATALSPGSIMFACGSEECNIHLVEYLDEVIRNVRTVKKHDAGIQHLKWSNDGRFLFSCGGQGELKIWEYHPVPVLEHGLVLVAELNVKTGGHPADVRIMAFDIKREMDPHIADSWFVITLVTSTSLIEVWNYTPINNTLARLFQTTYTSCALTQVTTIKLDSIRLILVAATDGHITAYRAPSKESRESTTIDFHQPLASLRVHQSAIKALEIHPLDQHRYLIFTAGDDNALHACILSIVPQSECRVAIQDLECNSNAHAAAINGLAIIHAFSPSEGRVVGFLATTGNDGLVKIWRWGYPANEIQSKERKTFLTCCGQLNSDVADATAMDHVTFNERVFIFVSGVGMEILSVQQQDLM